jgi:hypothetical protein
LSPIFLAHVDHSSALLAYRIHKVNSAIARSRTNTIRSLVYSVMRTAIDVAVLYTLLVVAAIINQVVSTNPFIMTCVVSHQVYWQCTIITCVCIDRPFYLANILLVHYAYCPFPSMPFDDEVVIELSNPYR